jgi:hypothetical protein
MVLNCCCGQVITTVVIVFSATRIADVDRNLKPCSVAKQFILGNMFFSGFIAY